MIKYGKYVVVVFLLVFLFILLGRDNVKDVPLTDIEAKMGSGSGIGVMQKADAKMLRRYYSLEEADVNEYLVYVPSGQMEVDEMAIFKVKDTSQIDTIKKVVQTRIDNQKKSFNGYGVQQTALLNKAAFVSKGKYVFLAISPSAEQLKEKFLQCVEE